MRCVLGIRYGCAMMCDVNVRYVRCVCMTPGCVRPSCTRAFFAFMNGCECAERVSDWYVRQSQCVLPLFFPSFFGCCTCTHQKLSSSYLANDEIISICKNVNAASVLRMMHVVKQHQHSIIENWIEWNISSESIWCETVARLFCPFSKFVQIEKRTRRRMESCFHCFSFPSLPND